MSLWVVIAAYNEETVITSTLDDLRPYGYSIVVVDDGSTDATARLAKKAGAYVVRHAINLGQGAALQTGIDYAIARGAEYVCTFDADGQHDPATIPIMLEKLQETDVDIVLGSRFLGEAIDMPQERRVLLQAARVFTRMQTGLQLTDVHNGLRLFTRTTCLKMRLTQSHMAHASEILVAIAKQHLRYVEVPTTIRYSSYSLKKGQASSGFIKIFFDLVYAAWIR
jgi:glycosyltransferase involved in cell wall biosynthesis